MAEGTPGVEGLPFFRMLQGIAEFDHALFQWINEAPYHPMVDTLSIAAAEASPAIAILVLGVLWFWPGDSRHQRRRWAVLLTMGVLLALGLTQIPALFVYRERPFVAGDVHLLVSAKESHAFPSRHVAGSGAFAAILFSRYRFLGRCAWLLTWIMMFSRVRVGVHYPFDVLGGALFGWAMGALIRRCRDELIPFADRIVAGTEAFLPF